MAPVLKTLKISEKRIKLEKPLKAKNTFDSTFLLLIGSMFFIRVATHSDNSGYCEIFENIRMTQSLFKFSLKLRLTLDNFVYNKKLQIILRLKKKSTRLFFKDFSEIYMI